MANLIPDPLDIPDTIREPAVIDAYVFRRLAEGASGSRGPRGDLYDVVGQPDRTLEVKARKRGTLRPAGTIIEVDTPAVEPNRPEVQDIALTVDGTQEHFYQKYDTVFCTEAAVEKFVLPYLASESLWLAAYYVQELSKAWYGFIPEPSNASAPASTEPIPFAIGHTPNSEFTPLTGPGGPHHLHVLFKKEGRIYGKPLAHFIAEQEAKGREKADPERRTPASKDGA